MPFVTVKPKFQVTIPAGLVTNLRAGMLEDGREDELNEHIADARAAQDRPLGGPSG